MTYPPEGPRSSGPGASGYGSYNPGGQSYGGPIPGQPNPMQGQGQNQGQGQGPMQGQGQQSPYSSGQPTPSPLFGQYNPPLNSNSSSLPRILTSVVLALGIISFLIGLAGQYEAFGETSNFFLISSGDPTSVALMLAAGITAGIGLLPKQPKLIGVAAALAISGWLVLVFQSFNTGDAGPSGMTVGIGAGAIAVLVLGFVQSAVAMVATLLDAGVMKAPAPKAVSYGQQNNYPGYGQQQSPGGYGQGPQQHTQPGQNQPGQPSSTGYGGYAPSQQNYGAPASSYAAPPYTGSQNQAGGPSKPDTQSNATGGLTGPASQDSPYGQYQYGREPVGTGSYGASQHAAEGGRSVDDASRPTDSDASTGAIEPESGVANDGPANDSAPTRAFGTTPSDGDNK